MEDGVFHERFRLAIKESGMTVREIAKQSGVKKRTIDRWIGQNPPVPNVLEFSYVSKAITKEIEDAKIAEKTKAANEAMKKLESGKADF